MPGPYRTVASVLSRAPGGNSGAMLCRLSNGDRAVVKAASNRHGVRSCVAEFVVSAVGQLIGAPVCVVSIVDIPMDLEGQWYGEQMDAGLASASLEVTGVLESRSLEHSSDDDNERRHAGVAALYDWCYGGDPQWLYQTTRANTIWSHDHGMYFPGAHVWTAQHLVAEVEAPHPLPMPLTGVSVAELHRLADALEALALDDIGGVLNWVPATWPIDDDDLRYLGWFLDERRLPTAGRLRTLAAGGAP